MTSILTVLHVNGYHKLQVQYCNCIGSPEPYLQLLHAGLFPATHARPSTAFTFQLLKHFQRFNLASKTAVHNYHKALLHLTDNVLPQSIPSSYHQFVDVIRQWRVVTMLRRAGKQRSTDLQDGELALACPACPRPGINLPPGWEDNPQRRLLYGKFISGDGNFHLVRRRNKAGTGKDAVAALQRRSSMIGDAAFWVPRAHFDSYLAASKGAAEQRPPQAQCNTVAGNPVKANTSVTGKNEITGAFAVSCRHVCFCANGVCDFSRGEGYRYVDVPMAMVINASINAGLKDLVISYDIACKYSINFLERVCNSPYPLLPDNLQSLVSILWLIGKFHLGGHREECQKFFNFNYTQGVGRMSGELVETIWSYFDFLKYQTREMGPGSRQEMLSDAMNYWNWQKIVKMSDKTRLAILQANVQCENASERLKGIEENLGPEVIQKLASASTQAGSDKYIPSKSKTKYPSRKEVLAALWKDEEASTPSAPDNHNNNRHGPQSGSNLQSSPHLTSSPPVPDVFRPLGPQSSPLAHRPSKRPHCHQTPDSPSDQDCETNSSASDSDWVDDTVDDGAPDSPLAQRQPKKVTSRKRKKRARVVEQPQINSQAEDPILTAEIHLARLSWLNAALTLETSQAKYIGLLEQHRRTALPGLKSSIEEKIRKHKGRLETGLDSHYEFLRSQGLPLSASQLYPKEPHQDPILVPSHLSSAQRQQFGWVKLASHEKQLRIGLAFDALLKLRKALGLRSFVSRHVRKTNGYTINTRTQETLKRAEMTVKHWSAAYRRSWEALMRLGAEGNVLQGLRPLEQKDLVLLSTWLEEEKYRDWGSSLPWIWSVAPLPHQETDVAAAIEDWSQEVIRLEWVHAHAALDRWLEENHLLREELGWIALSLRWAYQDWSSHQLLDSTDDEESDVSLGYRAFSLRTAYHYKRLASNALDNIARAGLPLPFDAL